MNAPRNILGLYRYDEDRDAWILEIGTVITRYGLICDQTDFPSVQEEFVNKINNALALHNIRARLPAPTGSYSKACIDQFVVGLIQQIPDANQSTALIIGMMWYYFVVSNAVPRQSSNCNLEALKCLGLLDRVVPNLRIERLLLFGKMLEAKTGASLRSLLIELS